MTVRLCVRVCGQRRFVYTSTIEACYHDNRCVDATEEATPRPAHPANPYQRSKIAAERLVLHAPSPPPSSAAVGSADLATVALRPGHIYGHPAEDEIGRFIQDVNACFSEDVATLRCNGGADAAPMSMVHVENVALAHVLAACQVSRADVRGRTFHVADFDESIISWYATASPPVMTHDGEWMTRPFDDGRRRMDEPV